MTNQGDERRHTLLLVEDDREDAVLIEALLEEAAEAGQPSGADEVVWVASLDEARQHLHRAPECVLLDLKLPDADPDRTLEEVVAAAPEAAVVVITGLEDEHLGLQAIARGAQDYLVKGRADGPVIARSLRYAIERKRAANTARRLAQAEVRAEQNARLERGLLPSPLLRSDDVHCMTLYRPGGERSLLGGDFFDVVELASGTIRAIVGDVSGHGPDQAALGIRLRVAWRALVLAGVPTGVALAAIQDLLTTERGSPECFVTACEVALSPSRASVEIRLAGHPPPVLVSEGGVVAFEAAVGLPLGVGEGRDWPPAEVRLGSRWAVLMYTDGLEDNVERGGLGPTVTGGGAAVATGGPAGSLEGIAGFVQRAVAAGQSLESLVRETLPRLGTTRSASATDDVAIVALFAGGSLA